MNFISPVYGIFLLIVLGSYWAARSQSVRLWTLLIFSLIFYAYASFSPQSDSFPYEQLLHIPLLLVITLLNFALGQAMSTNSPSAKKAIDPNLSNQEWQQAHKVWNRQRSQLLGAGIILNVLLLIGFKYVNFIVNSIQALLSLPITQPSASNSLIAPLGLSFFCFECIAYLIDVYRGAPAPQKFLDFAAYKLFFPKLIAGPITRYHNFARDRMAAVFPKVDRWAEGLWLIACGAVKKALLADNLGKIVDLIWGSGNLERAGSSDLWLAIAAYGLQLYLDFTGYVDMARGSAILLGFNLPENFNFPYFTTSIAEFWRRWHMTLGDWLRNYLYFPLGGSRQGLVRTCLNLLIIMLIAGLWHGAAWGYVVWGALHGLALVIHRLTETVSSRIQFLNKWWQTVPGIIIAWLLTQSMVFISWIFFRLPNLKDSTWVIQRLWGHNADIQFSQKVYGEALSLSQIQIVLILAILMILMAINYALHRGLKLQLNWPVKLLLVPVCLYIVWIFAPEGGLPYIYFDF